MSFSRTILSLIYSLSLSASLLLAGSSYAKEYIFMSAKGGDSSDVSAVAGEGDEVIVDFHIHKMVTEKAQVENSITDAFKELKFTQLKSSNNVGSPAIPYYSIIVEGTPANLRVDYQMEKSKRIMNLIPVPAQPEKWRCVDCEQPSFAIDLDSYRDGEERFYTLDYLGDFRGIPLTRVTLYPAQYIAEDRAVEIYPEIDFKISGAIEGKFYTDNVEQIYERAELNNRYLIIAPQEYIAALAEFVAWKSSRGFEVDVISLESAGGTFAAVKSYIRARYEAPETNFSYALLVGHEGNFPTEYVYTSSSSQTPSDLHYFTMGDATDFIPDVFYGRLVVGQLADISNQVRKIMDYEGDLLSNGAGWSQHIGLASDEGSDPSDEEYLAQMTSTFVESFGVSSRSFLQRNSDSTPTNLNKALSSGAMWLNYIGHGTGTSWPSMWSTYYSSSIKNLTTDAVKPIIIDVACQNGRFRYNAKQLGERFMNESKDGAPVGAVAYYGGSVNISWNPPAVMAVGLNKMVVQEKIDALGKALLAGQIYLFNNYTDVASVKENFSWYHLFGDPSLSLHIGR